MATRTSFTPYDVLEVIEQLGVRYPSKAPSAVAWRNLRKLTAAVRADLAAMDCLEDDAAPACLCCIPECECSADD